MRDFGATKLELPVWPSFSDEEADAVARVVRSGAVNYWTGDEGKCFEKEFAEFSGTKHAIACSNGTVALDLALNGLGIGSRNGGQSTDEVIVTARSFIASASSVVNAGARPVFADVGEDSQNITPETIAPLLTRQTRAIICVHLAGWPCDMDAIRDLVSDRDIFLIEDCAQAHGALYKGRPVGGLGDVAAWSFCQDKIMTTGGEGGMVTCNNDDVYKRMWSFKDHGKSYDKVFNPPSKPNGFRWLHDSFGTNGRMTEMQAVLGRIQLRKMSEWTAQRTRNAHRLSMTLAAVDGGRDMLRIPSLSCKGCNNPNACSNGCRHAWYKYYTFVHPENLPNGWSRDIIAEKIRERGVTCLQGSCPEMYLESAFDNTDMRPASNLPVARKLGETSLMFLVHPTLSNENMDAICNVVEDVFSEIR